MRHQISEKLLISSVGVSSGGLSTETKNMLKNRKKAACFKCNSKKSYTNPMEKCFECKEKFCFDHIIGGLSKEGMSQNEEFRSTCERCKKDHDY